MPENSPVVEAFILTVSIAVDLGCRTTYFGAISIIGTSVEIVMFFFELPTLEMLKLYVAINPGIALKSSEVGVTILGISEMFRITGKSPLPTELSMLRLCE